MDNLFNMAVILSAIDKASGPIGKVTNAMGDLTSKAHRMAEVGQQMTVAGALTQGAADQMTGALGSVINPAIQFESTMADVRKVVDFPTPDSFQKMGDDILAMSTRIPMAATGLGDIMAAAGQAGIAREELLRFTEDAAKMGVAFDMSGAEAGGAMTGLRSIFQLTQDEVVQLGDATNHLANNMDATAGGLLNIMNRAGSTAKLLGMTGQQTAALGATFLALKTPPEVAATGMNALFNKLATADKQSGKFQDALAGIGMNAQDLKAALKDDAQGALMDFLGAVKQSDDVMGTLTDLFGAEYADDMAKLVGGLDTYRNAVGLVADETSYAGSMQKEYAERSNTTEAQLQRTSGILNRLGVTLGNLVLPAINDGLAVLQDFGNAMTDFAKANPLLFKIALGFFGILAVALAVIAPILSVVGGLVMMGSYGLMGVSKLGKGLAWLRPHLAGALGRVRALIAGVLRFAFSAARQFLGASLRMATSLARQFVPAALAAIQRLGALTLAGLRFAARGAVGFVSSVARMGVALLSSLVPALGAAISGAWAFTAALLANPITWIVLAIAGAAALIYTFWDPIKGFFIGLWNDVEAAFNAGWVEGVLKVLELFNPVAWVAKGMNALVQYLFGFDLSAAAGAVVDSILTGLSTAWQGLTAWFQGQWQQVVGAFDQGLFQGLATVFAKINPVNWLRQAFAGVSEFLFGFDLSAAGANIINTIWEGMKSMASKPVEMIKSIVGKVREYLPFSPAKVGPLKDLDRIKLVETVAESVRPEPLVNAMRNTAAAGMAAVTMAGAPAAAQLPTAIQEVRQVATGAPIAPAVQAVRAAQGAPEVPRLPTMAPVATVAAPEIAEVPEPTLAAAGPVNVSFSITVEGDASDRTVEQLEQRLTRWVQQNGRLIARAVGREQDRAGRTDFTGG